jgi:hypothetical protein
MHQSDEAIGLSCRYKANLEKLGSGNLAKVAEVVSDLDVREREAGLSECLINQRMPVLTGLPGLRRAVPWRWAGAGPVFVDV